MIALREDQYELANKIREHYGDDVELNQLKLECEELNNAIEYKDDVNMHEELADVLICLHHVLNGKLIDRELLLSLIDYKLNRQLKRMESENK